MTRIAERQTKMSGETAARYRGRPLMVTITAHEVHIREYKRVRGFAVPWLAVYELGMKLAAIEARQLKAARRKAGSQ